MRTVVSRYEKEIGMYQSQSENNNNNINSSAAQVFFIFL